MCDVSVCYCGVFRLSGAVSPKCDIAAQTSLITLYSVAFCYTDTEPNSSCAYTWNVRVATLVTHRVLLFHKWTSEFCAQELSTKCRIYVWSLHNLHSAHLCLVRSQPSWYKLPGWNNITLVIKWKWLLREPMIDYISTYVFIRFNHEFSCVIEKSATVGHTSNLCNTYIHCIVMCPSLRTLLACGRVISDSQFAGESYIF